MKNLIKVFGIIAIIAIIVFSMSCGGGDDGGSTTIPVTGVSLNKTDLSLAVGGSYLVRKTTVGSYTANNYGLYDMHGNVNEWCWDWDRDYASGSQTDPTGAVTGWYRVACGGCYDSYGQNLRSAFRFGYDPKYRNGNFGFRLVRS